MFKSCCLKSALHRDQFRRQVVAPIVSAIHLFLFAHLQPRVTFVQGDIGRIPAINPTWWHASNSETYPFIAGGVYSSLLLTSSLAFFFTFGSVATSVLRIIVAEPHHSAYCLPFAPPLDSLRPTRLSQSPSSHKRPRTPLLASTSLYTTPPR